MLIRITGKQASRHWDDIKGAIEQALPPFVGNNTDRMSNILTAILTEELTLWVSADKVKGINAIALTSFTIDKISGTTGLLVYAVYGYGNMDSEVWKEGFKVLQTHARKFNCDTIYAYSTIPSIIKYAESLGANTSYRFISLPIA